MGQMCGFDTAVKDFPDLYFTDFSFAPTGDETIATALTRVLASGVCVKKCPDEIDVMKPEWWTTECSKNTKTSCPTVEKHGYSSVAFFPLNYCIPDIRDKTESNEKLLKDVE